MQTSTNTAANANGQLFDIRKGVDGKFRVWTQKTDLELGLVSRSEYEEAGRPIYLNTARWVVVGVYEKKPTTTTVLELLGVKRRETPAKSTTPTKSIRPRKPAVKVAA